MKAGDGGALGTDFEGRKIVIVQRLQSMFIHQEGNGAKTMKCWTQKPRWLTNHEFWIMLGRWDKLLEKTKDLRELDLLNYKPSLSNR